jgi:hypothetical protein
MAETNVSSAFNATGVLEFFGTSIPGNVSAPKLMQIDRTSNGINFQLAAAAIACNNSQVINYGYALTFIDNTGTVYYVSAATALW